MLRISKDKAAAARRAEELKQLERCYLTVFGEPDHRTEEQKTVLRDLTERFCVNDAIAFNGAVNTDNVLLAEGKRQVVIFVLKTVNDGLLTRNLTNKEND